MLIQSMRFAGALLATLVVGGQLSAQDASITDYNPKTITTGTVITIQGNFAAKTSGKIPKPKVFGTSTDTKAKVILKVLSNTETEIMAEVKKVPTNKKNPAAGTDWTLNVQPKGKGALGATTSGSPMTVVGPVVTGVNPSTAMPGEEVTITIGNAGSKPPKMKIGGKKAKLKPAPSTQEADLTSFITKVPKSLANGAWNIDIDNKIGTDTSMAALTVTGSTKKIGKFFFKATVGGAPYTASKKLSLATTSQAGLSLQAQAKGSKPAMTFTVFLPFIGGTTPTPATYDNFGLSQTFRYTETTVISRGFPPNIDLETWAALQQGDISLTINAFSGGQVAGTFTGFVRGEQAQGNLNVSGEFVMDVEQQ